MYLATIWGGREEMRGGEMRGKATSALNLVHPHTGWAPIGPILLVFMCRLLNVIKMRTKNILVCYILIFNVKMRTKEKSLKRKKALHNTLPYISATSSSVSYRLRRTVLKLH